MDNFDELVAKKYLKIKQSAESRGLEFDLSLTSIKNMMKAGKCYYSGIQLTLTKSNDNMPPNYFTVDRKDSRKGYVKGNVVACSHAANQLKSVMENSRNVLTLKQKCLTMSKTLEILEDK